MPDIFQRPFSIKIFVPDGDPDGLRIVEKSNWTGAGVVFNRSNYKQALGREELGRTGVYVLVGASDSGGFPTIYVGEGDPVKDRINQHYSKKDFWDWAVCFVTKDHSLNKAHVQLLECRLIQLATAAKQCKLDNGNEPQPPTLSEPDTADIESFLLDMLSIFPLLGLGVFEKTETTPRSATLLHINARGIKATGYEDARGFVVLKDSQSPKKATPTTQQFVISQREDLLGQGVIADAGDHYVFTQDHLFRSPSTASSVVLGRSSNGRETWKTKEGRTLKELQEEAAGRAGGEA
jgi:hypothetical protein